MFYPGIEYEETCCEKLRRKFLLIFEQDLDLRFNSREIHNSEIENVWIVHSFSPYPTPMGTAVCYCAIPSPGKRQKHKSKEIIIERRSKLTTTTVQPFD